MNESTLKCIQNAMYVENGCFKISELQIIDYRLFTARLYNKNNIFPAFWTKMIKFEKLRQSKVNPDVKNEVNIPFD